MIEAGRGTAWPGRAWQGRRGKARHGVARQGMAGEAIKRMEQPEPNTEITCAKEAVVYRLAPEHFFRLWLQDRKRHLKKERLAHLTAADRLKQEIAEYDRLLEELTIK